MQKRSARSYTKLPGYIDRHIQEVLALELVAVEAIRKVGFKVVVDGVNPTGNCYFGPAQRVTR